MTIKQALAQANQKLLPKIHKALEQEVYEVVKAEEISAIQSEVYDVYDPKEYARRSYGGGMLDDSNIVIKGGKASNGSIAVENVTPANHGGVSGYDSVTVNKNLPELIEYGDGYNGYKYDFPGKGTGKFLEPRPFTQKTVENLKSTGSHIAALKNGLQRQGVKVE